MASPRSVASRTHVRWWGFWLYATVSVVHVGAISFGLDPLVYPTKLLLMPALALAVLWAFLGNSDTGGAREPAPRRVIVLLVAAIAFSWFGDGASFFFPMFDDELPAMLLCFGVAHLLYIWLFVRPLARRRVPIWTLAYAVWWGVMIAVLWTHLGALLVPVMVYGLVLGGTAVAATRGGAITAIGGAFFLASDTILAFRLFLPGGSESLAGPWIMLTYTIGQGLLAYGIMRLLRTERA